MRRVFLVLVILVVAAIALPPLWYAVFPDALPEMPPPGRRVELADGIALNVLDEGRGPAVVLSHGHPGCAYDWQELVPKLVARGHRVLAYDRAGYGHSDARPDGPYGVEQNAKDLLGLLEALDLRDATVVGWSFGGMTAIAAAHQDASRMGRLVLVGSGGPGMEDSPPPPLFVRLLFSGPVLRWVARVPPAARGLREMSSMAAFSEQPQPDWWQPTLAANLGSPKTARHYRAEGEASFSGPIPDPTGLDLPVLVAHGDDDNFVALAIGEELARRAPRARLSVYEDGSHMLPVTHAERFADEIAKFVRNPGL